MDEALAIANGTQYALTGGLISRSPATIARVRREFLVGNLYINRGTTGALVERQAFGGFKMSGVGSKAGGPDYLAQFMGCGSAATPGRLRRRRRLERDRPQRPQPAPAASSGAKAAHDVIGRAALTRGILKAHVHGASAPRRWRAPPASCGRTAASFRPGCSEKVRSAAPTRFGRQRRKSRKRRTTSSTSPR